MLTQAPHFLLTKSEVRVEVTVRVRVRVRVSENACCSINIRTIKPSNYRHTAIYSYSTGGRHNKFLMCRSRSVEVTKTKSKQAHNVKFNSNASE